MRKREGRHRKTGKTEVRDRAKVRKIDTGGRKESRGERQSQGRERKKDRGERQSQGRRKKERQR